MAKRNNAAYRVKLAAGGPFKAGQGTRSPSAPVRYLDEGVLPESAGNADRVRALWAAQRAALTALPSASLGMVRTDPSYRAARGLDLARRIAARAAHANQRLARQVWAAAAEEEKRTRYVANQRLYHEALARATKAEGMLRQQRASAAGREHPVVPSSKQTRGGAKPPDGYSQIFTGGQWQPAHLNLRGQAMPIYGSEGVRFPNTPEGKSALYQWMRDHKAQREGA